MISQKKLALALLLTFFPWNFFNTIKSGIPFISKNYKSGIPFKFPNKDAEPNNISLETLYC